MALEFETYNKDERRGGSMASKKRIEVFSAGCSVCKETIETVKRLAGTNEVVVQDMRVFGLDRTDRTAGERAVQGFVG